MRARIYRLPAPRSPRTPDQIRADIEATRARLAALEVELLEQVHDNNPLPASWGGEG